MSLAIPNPYKVEEVARPKQTVTSDTILGVIEKEPISKRFSSMREHQLEFMSYLRPVLKDSQFDDGDGEGWGFLAGHVQQNSQVFVEILKERNRRAAIITQRQERSKRIKQKI